MKEETVYLDNSSSTKMDEEILEAMKPYLFEKYAVASSEFGYSLGIKAKEGLEDARSTIADNIGANSEEIIFTSCGTEASNLALKGVAEKLPEKKDHIITSKIEDFPVLKSAQRLEKEGYEVTFLEVDDEGFVDVTELEDAIKESTGLVSIQHGNQEIGTVQDIEKISKICDQKDVLFHTDATHTFTKLPIDISKTRIDLMTLSGHTIHGPKGIGALYVKDGTDLEKLMDGGFQENNRRAGVENIPGAVGFAKAVELVNEEENQRLKEMRDALIKKIQDKIPDTTLNGPLKDRTPQNANITFHYVEGESITLHMDMRGFSVSTGSACFSKSLEASHVILGIGGDHERAHGSVRFSFGRYNTMEDVDRTVEAISEVVERLREISPLGKDK
ncbi:MAG: cysteine desulfurase family protein [Thermoplasmatota archaeon]